MLQASIFSRHRNYLLVPQFFSPPGDLSRQKSGGEFVKQTMKRPHPRGEVTGSISGVCVCGRGVLLSKGEGEGRNRILPTRPVAELVTVTAGPCPGQRTPQTHISRF